MKSCLILSLYHSITYSFTLPFLSCSHMYNTYTHAHTLYYLQKHKLMLEDHNHCHSPRIHICDSPFDFSSSMHNLCKIIIIAPLIYFSLSLRLSLILDITSPLHTLHGYVMQCTLCYWVYIGVYYVFLFHQRSQLSGSMSLNLTSPVLLHSIETVSLLC